MLRATPVRRIGTLSTALANSALYLAHWAGLQTPAAALLLAGCFFRCLTLPTTIYGDQCLRRTAGALPELQDAFKDYLNIVEHPDAISWEKRVAAQKLKNDRERVFRNHHTNNVKMIVPHVVAAAASLYCLSVPAQQLGTFFVQEVGMSIVSPLAVSYLSAGHFAWTSSLATSAAATATAAAAAAAPSSSLAAATTTALFTVDPTLPLAVSLTCVNVCLHLQQRTGFNTRLDGWIGQARRIALAGGAVVAVGSLVSGPLAYAVPVLPAMHFFPPYLAPVWLGMSATTTVKTLLVNYTAPGCALFRLMPYPPQHGTYGEESTAAGHEYRLAFTGLDVEETRHVWLQQKRILDYECDIRIHRWLTRLGLFNDTDELALEGEKLQQKRAVARERRLAREAMAGNDGLTEGARRRRARRRGDDEETDRVSETAASAAVGGSSGPVSVAEKAAAEAQVDRIQAEERQRLMNVKAARETAWKKKHAQDRSL